MNQTFYNLTTGFSMLLGVSLWFGVSMHFDEAGKLEYELNPASIKGSPYGKVLALAMQGPIDLYWHNGETHESAEILNKEHEHADGTSHSHGEHDHGEHDHGEHDHGEHDHGEHLSLIHI